jgi:hypothetical protein
VHAAAFQRFGQRSRERLVVLDHQHPHDFIFP